mmetsp:Transcript_81288/g.162169  ORF Transcript_81288/g.162169 Transcript_81288/m.162169 type:complete len:221 (-) Transcript_81288:417-1079(-)
MSMSPLLSTSSSSNHACACSSLKSRSAAPASTSCKSKEPLPSMSTARNFLIAGACCRFLYSSLAFVNTVEASFRAFFLALRIASFPGVWSTSCLSWWWEDATVPAAKWPMSSATVVCSLASHCSLASVSSLPNISRPCFCIFAEYSPSGVLSISFMCLSLFFSSAARTCLCTLAFSSRFTFRLLRNVFCFWANEARPFLVLLRLLALSPTTSPASTALYK